MFECVVGAAREETTAEVWEDIGGDEDARVGQRMERDPPPSFTTPTNNHTFVGNENEIMDFGRE